MGMIRYLRNSGGRSFWLAQSVKDEAISGQPVTVTGKANVANVKKIIESDGRYTIRNIAKFVGISLSLGQYLFWSVFWKYERFLSDWYSIYWQLTKKDTSTMQLLKVFPKLN